jgi:hypothetical protein
MPQRFLAIYLNDHLAGSALGVELARRTLRENRGNELGALLVELAPEIEQDRATLVSLMARLGIATSPLKQAAGWAAEKVGRLKPNGQLRGYTPLARVLELEGLAAGIRAKEAMWLSLREVAPGEGDFDALAERARSQRERLEPHRLEAARLAFG